MRTRRQRHPTAPPSPLAVPPLRLQTATAHARRSPCTKAVRRKPLGDPLTARPSKTPSPWRTYSFADRRRHDALLDVHRAVPAAWAAWHSAAGPLRAPRPHRRRSRTARPSAPRGRARALAQHGEPRAPQARGPAVLIYRNDFAVQRWRGKVRPIFAPTVQGYNALRQLRGVRRAAVASGDARLVRADRIALARLLERLCGRLWAATSVACAQDNGGRRPDERRRRGPDRAHRT